MKTYHILLFILSVTVFTSCQNEIPFNSKHNNPQIILNAMIDIDDEEHFIILSKTGTYNIDSIHDAIIHIYINGTLREQLTEPLPHDPNTLPDDPYFNYVYESSIKKKRYKTNLRFHPGDNVKIEVFAENDKYHAWAEDVVPKPLPIDNIDTTTFITKNEDLYYLSWMRLKTTFTDFPNEKNFYRLALVLEETIYDKSKETGVESVFSYKNIAYLNTQEDIVLNDGRISTDDDLFAQTENRFAVFDDTRLNGSYTMTTSFYGPTNNYMEPKESIIERVSVNCKIYLISITEMQYYYLRALNIKYSDDYDEYFSMPVSMPSNVHGGTGFVGFSASTYATFSTPDIIPDTTIYNQAYYPY
ncbi:MAG: DUF4249 domain-containing protein [Tannerella sp.]|jgi:hypothetical protein|nr:DUF4249 domain-containing protein [Tannerella sp.]